ncbi:MAG: single-stranded-DNA-specific exonuclease RecJ [Ruminococcaceae bacterium]|nr:single-stranded-DNA-specific exonuclease RecJ [Oscillospiraceae bacterium]
MAHKKWVVREADKERATVLSEKFNIDPFIAYMLTARGMGDDLTVSKFLSDSFETVSPFKFADMEEAAFTVGDAIDYGEKICVYGDYDCDGVTSTALLLSFLRREGADVFAYIPDREGEGYGLNKDAITKIHEDGAELIITVDNGISSVEEAEYIYSLGMRLVVTDHHQLGDVMPRAEAVVNPHREDNDLDFREYCGVGVAFKLICAMYEGDISELVDEYIDLVTIGTIADVVPLLGENRAFVKLGLDRINNSPRKSLVPFRNTASGKKFTSNDIAFQLCPRINAMGRMGSAMEAVDFLLSEDEAECEKMYELLTQQNSKRQNVEKEILDAIEQQISDNPKLVSERVIVIAGDGYHHGVIGIVASHILERYGKPAFVIGIDDDGVARGSARSVAGFNIHEAISACSGDLIKFGGHPLAAGITLNADKVDDFRQHINEFAYNNYDIMPPQELVIDCKLSPFYINTELVDNIAQLEPYGAENPSPVFGVYNMTVTEISPLSEGRHTRFELEKKGKRMKAAMFSHSPESLPIRVGDRVNAAVRVSKNLYNGKEYLSVHIADICLAGIDDDKYFKEKNDYELYRAKGTVCGTLYPDRDVCACIYKYLRACGGYDYSLDDLYFRLQSKATYGQLVIAIKAFVQAGLIDYSGKITLKTNTGKVDLDSVPVLRTLKGKMLSEQRN